MLKVTRWSPDTCRCVLEYEWDDAEDENTRENTLKAVIQKCSYHSFAADEDVYREVLLENSIKNIAFAEAERIIPSINPENYKWSFDEGRKLKVQFPDVTSAQKAKLLQTFSERFGEGKVEVL